MFKRVRSSTIVPINAESVADELFELVDHTKEDLALFPKLLTRLTEYQITFSFDMEVIDRMSGVGDEWDVTLARIYVNSLSKDHIRLLKSLVEIAQKANQTDISNQLASFLLPPFTR